MNQHTELWITVYTKNMDSNQGHATSVKRADEEVKKFTTPIGFYSQVKVEPPQPYIPWGLALLTIVNTVAIIIIMIHTA